MPENISFEEAALSEPLAISAYAVSELTGVKSGDYVLVSGPGPIGLLVLQCALAEGAFVIMSGTNADESRLKIAKELGAHRIVNVQQEDLGKVIRSYDELGADIVFECSGAGPAVKSGIEVIRKGGKFTQVGLFGHPIEVNMDLVVTKELRIMGVFSSNWRGWHQGLRLVKQNKIQLKPVISHVLPVSEWEKAFNLIESKQSLKVVLTPES
jgi:L-iditol 2-dehydrogenase